MFSSVYSRVGSGFLSPAPAPTVSPTVARTHSERRYGVPAPLRFAGRSDSISVQQSEALCLAARNGDFQRLKPSLEAGFNPDFEDSLGNRILHYAVECRNREAVQALISAGAQVDALDGTFHRRSPLMIAARRGSLDLVKCLLQAGANIELPDDLYGCRPLHHAAIGGHVEVVKGLLDAGAVVDAKDYKGATPLQLAQRMKRAEVVQLLAQAEAEAAEVVQLLAQAEAEAAEVFQLLAQAEAASDPPFRGFPILPLVFPESIFFAKRP